MYQRRKNLQFYRIHEEIPDEDTTGIPYNFLETELGMRNAHDIDFQRVHRVGKWKQGSEPRAIIACFLSYQDRENAFTDHSSIAGKQDLGIGVDLPSKWLKFARGPSQKCWKQQSRGSEQLLADQNHTSYS